jgi:endo-1,4-beta-mannosidase
MPAAEPAPSETRFHVGVNYWPARTAMAWWSNFDQDEVAADFARIAATGLDSVRLFLTWEAFQPAPSTVEAGMLDRLAAVADLAGRAGLAVMPTLFTGHMSGVNLIPPWALDGSERSERFRVLSGGRVTTSGLRNWYADADVAAAQALLAGEAAAALAGHDALWAWDLGNENSNCVIPPNRAAAQRWLDQITSAIRRADPAALITTGLHMEDLEEDRKLGPWEAAQSCDLLSMHGYPIYADWAESVTDEQLLPFLADVTRWLGGGRDLVFSEFGVPTYREGDPDGEAARRASRSPLIEEDVAAAYIERGLTALRDAGCAGAMLWCYTDYESAIWDVPPLDQAIHERSFGLWRADGSPKPSVEAVTALTGTERIARTDDYTWIDIEPTEFFVDPGTHLRRLYRRYRQKGPRAAR